MMMTISDNYIHVILFCHIFFLPIYLPFIISLRSFHLYLPFVSPQPSSSSFQILPYLLIHPFVLYSTFICGGKVSLSKSGRPKFRWSFKSTVIGSRFSIISLPRRPISRSINSTEMWTRFSLHSDQRIISCFLKNGADVVVLLWHELPTS